MSKLFTRLTAHRQATRQIRNPQSKVHHHAVPIIAMTAHAMQGDRERCIDGA
jgi:CheY-like chemotaxis protein